jgi:hypothetical protein
MARTIASVARHRRSCVAALATFVPFVLACTFSRAAAAPDGDPMIVTEDQIARLQATTAYEVVYKTHANFLHSRGRESQDPNTPPIPAHVYVDDTYYGDVNTLRNIPVGDVGEIHFYQSYEAQYKFGSGHPGGVIQVITKH